MKRKLVAALLAAMLVGFSALNAFTVAEMGRTWSESAVCSIGSKTVPELSLLAALYPELKWTAYAQSPSQTVFNDDLPSRTAEAAVLSFLGAAERIAFFPLACGRLPLEAELGACALDADTAFRLFKSANVAGKRIRLGERTLIVTGVINIGRPIVLVPAEADAALSHLAADDRAKMLTLSMALEGQIDAFSLSGAELKKLMGFLCAVPWLLAAAHFLALLKKRGARWRSAGAVLRWSLALGAALAFLTCLPVRLLPARWSDLAFYGQQLAAYQARPFQIPDIRDQLLKSDTLRAGGWCAMACIALWMERMWLRCEKWR